MNLRCVFGHDSTSGRYGNGLSSGPCDACGRLLIRRPGGRWYAMPREYTLDRSPSGRHAISPNALLRIARKRSFVLQRFRRRDNSFGGYFSSDGVDPGPGPWIRLIRDRTDTER